MRLRTIKDAIDEATLGLLPPVETPIDQISVSGSEVAPAEEQPVEMDAVAWRKPLVGKPIAEDSTVENGVASPARKPLTPKDREVDVDLLMRDSLEPNDPGGDMYRAAVESDAKRGLARNIDAAVKELIAGFGGPKSVTKIAAPNEVNRFDALTKAQALAKQNNLKNAVDYQKTKSNQEVAELNRRNAEIKLAIEQERTKKQNAKTEAEAKESDARTQKLLAEQKAIEAKMPVEQRLMEAQAANYYAQASGARTKADKLAAGPEKKPLPPGELSGLSRLPVAVEKLGNLQKEFEGSGMGDWSAKPGMFFTKLLDLQNTDSARYLKASDLAMQAAGLIFEEGKLAEGDVQRYRDMLPKATDKHPEIAIRNAMNFLADTVESQVNYLKDNYQIPEQAIRDIEKLRAMLGSQSQANSLPPGQAMFKSKSGATFPLSREDADELEKAGDGVIIK